MARTPDDRQIYHCPDCGGGGQKQRARATRDGSTEFEIIDCPTCDGSGQIVGGPA